MASHTPGPWKARDYPNKEGGIWIDCDAWTKRGKALGGTLATAHKTGCGEGEVEANAALIAASPDLLTALQGYLADHDADERELAQEAGITPSPCDCSRCRAARAAIVKATRETS